jgi:hypothetical protein
MYTCSRATLVDQLHAHTLIIMITLCRPVLDATVFFVDLFHKEWSSVRVWRLAKWFDLPANSQAGSPC